MNSNGPTVSHCFSTCGFRVGRNVSRGAGVLVIDPNGKASGAATFTISAQFGRAARLWIPGRICHGAFDQLSGILGRLGTSLCQVSHFVGNHNEAQTRLSRPSCLDSSVHKIHQSEIIRVHTFCLSLSPRVNRVEHKSRLSRRLRQPRLPPVRGAVECSEAGLANGERPG
jgi:hypothetical protein